MSSFKRSISVIAKRSKISGIVTAQTETGPGRPEASLNSHPPFLRGRIFDGQRSGSWPYGALNQGYILQAPAIHLQKREIRRLRLDGDDFRVRKRAGKVQSGHADICASIYDHARSARKGFSYSRKPERPAPRKAYRWCRDELRSAIRRRRNTLATLLFPSERAILTASGANGIIARSTLAIPHPLNASIQIARLKSFIAALRNDEAGDRV